MRQLFYIFLLFGALACASTPKAQPDPVLIEAEPAVVKPPEVKEILVPVPYAVAGTDPKKMGPTQAEIETAKKRAKENPKKVIEEMRQGALQSLSDRDGYIGAMRVFSVMPGAVYPINSAPRHSTLIFFGKGERVLSVARGDKYGWDVARLESADYHYLALTPHVANKHMSLFVVTTWGRYWLELTSVQHKGHLPMVSFRHPRRQIERYDVEIKTRQAQAQAKAQKALEPSPKIARRAADLEFGYDLVRFGTLPSWKPVMVYHDGKRTFIEFPDTKVRPALFIKDTSGQLEIVQYSISGRRYIVPMVLERAELRIGKSKAERVGLELQRGARR